MQDQIACSYGGFNEIKFLREKICGPIQIENNKKQISKKSISCLYKYI